MYGERVTYGIYPQYSFETSEQASLDFNLGIPAKEYASFKEDIESILTITINLEESEKKRFSEKEAHRKCRQIHAGFVKFERDQELIFANKVFDSAPDAAITLCGPIPGTLELLVNEQRGFGKKTAYSSREDRIGKDTDGRRKSPLPFQVLPSETRSPLNSHMWGLRFVINDPRVRKITLKSLAVHVPPEVQSVENTDGIFEAEQSQVCWKDLKFYKDGMEIRVDFIKPIFLADRIECSYSVEVEGIGIGGLEIDPGHVWHPDGLPADRDKISIKRSLVMAGTITAATRLQPRNQEVIARQSRSEPETQLTVTLAHALIKAFSDRGLYCKQIIEIPENVASQEKGNAVSRYWEIIGRFYIKYQPYDVHIVLAGAEAQAEGEGPFPSNLNVDIIVRNLSDVQFVDSENQDAHSLAHNLALCVEEVIGKGKMHD